MAKRINRSRVVELLGLLERNFLAMSDEEKHAFAEQETTQAVVVGSS